MSIFNNELKKDDSKQNTVLEDYERKVEERKQEYKHLNAILQGMRVEVSDLMLEIKKLSEEVVEKNAEKFLVEQKLDDLDQNYRLLLQDIDFKQNIVLSLNENIEALNKRTKADLSIQEDLLKIKDEYDLILKQISDKKLELAKIEEKKVLLLSTTNGESSGFNLKRGTKKKVKNCLAITKDGSRCKRVAVENSKFCSMHMKKMKG